MAVAWSQYVNTKFYDIQIGAKENTKEVKFESGKTRTYLLNSTVKKTVSAKLALWSSDEASAFWSWYNNTARSGSKSFVLPDFMDTEKTAEYKFTSTPTMEGQIPKELSIEIVEE